MSLIKQVYMVAKVGGDSAGNTAPVQSLWSQIDPGLCMINMAAWDAGDPYSSLTESLVSHGQRRGLAGARAPTVRECNKGASNRRGEMEREFLPKLIMSCLQTCRQAAPNTRAHTHTHTHTHVHTHCIPVARVIFL